LGKEGEIMPNLKTAKKNLRKSKKRATANKEYKKKIDFLFKKIKKEVKAKGKNVKEMIKEFYQVVDKTAKRKIIHKNKAARLKSRVTKLAFKKQEK